ncbi:MAG: CHAT domain-containing protein [Candidatus Sulfotelmatobacter sp.]
MKLLSSEPALPAGELAVQKYRFEGMAFTALHRFADAEQRFAQSDVLCASHSFAPCADVLNARGMLEMARANFAQGQSFFSRVLTEARASGDRAWQAETLLNLSWAAEEQAHYDEALDWANEAETLALSIGVPDVSEKALGDMGWAYYKLGDLEKAQGMFIDAEQQAEKLGEIASQVGWLTNAGYTYMDAGQFEAAKQAFQQSLKLAQQISSREDIMDARTALAFVSEKTGKLEEAKHHADEALAMARSYGNKEDVLYPLLVEGRIAAQQNDIAAAENGFQQIADSADAPVFLKWEAQRSLARLYENENHADATDREYRAALSTFEAGRCGLHQRVDNRLPFLSNAARIYEDYVHFLVARGRPNDALQVADYSRARTLAEGLGRPCKATFAPDPLNAPEIARRAGGTILFYALGEHHSYLWVINSHQARLLSLPATKSEVDEAVQRYRKKLEGPSEILEASNDGNLLYQMLVEPARDSLTNENNNTIFIIPDGALNSLNFETLVPEPPPQPKRYWIEDVTIVNAASLRLLPASRDRRGKLAGKLLLIGNRVAPAGDDSYPELPNSAVQMKNVEKYFPRERQQIFERQQASPSAYLKNHPERFSYIHFVAHGTASPMNPLDSAIILNRDPSSTAPADQDDSFKLYARDIIQQNSFENHNPLHAELVTISACYSNGKRTYSGEGLVGLSWAFLRAGAHNVIGALWDVSDASTPQLIDEFYNELNKGKSPSAALRTAKLSLLHNRTFHSPFYWAPFQLYTGS